MKANHVGWLLFGLSFVLACVLPEPWLYVTQSHNAESQAATAVGERFACPMFCVLLDQRPHDARCPVCAMELERIGAGLELDPEARQRIRLTATPLLRDRFEIQRDYFGRVAFDERAQYRMTSRISGKVESAPIEGGGTLIQQGDVLVELSSAVLLAAQTDYLVAWRASGGDKPTTAPAIGSTAEYLTAAALRLADMGCDGAELEALRKRGSGDGRLRLRSPQDGVIVRQAVTDGAAVQAGEELLSIADPARLRVEVELLERERSELRMGQRATIERVALPGAARTAKLTWVAAQIDAASHRSLVRFDFDAEEKSTEHWLPGSTVRIHVALAYNSHDTDRVSDTPAEYALALPRDAVLRSGTRAIAYALCSTGADPQLLVRLPAADALSYRAIELELGPLVRLLGDSSEQSFWIVRQLRDAAGAPFAAVIEPGVLFARNAAFLLDAQAELSGAPALRHTPATEPPR